MKKIDYKNTYWQLFAVAPKAGKPLAVYGGLLVACVHLCSCLFANACWHAMARLFCRDTPHLDTEVERPEVVSLHQTKRIGGGVVVQAGKLSVGASKQPSACFGLSVRLGMPELNPEKCNPLKMASVAAGFRVEMRAQGGGGYNQQRVQNQSFSHLLRERQQQQQQQQHLYETLKRFASPNSLDTYCDDDISTYTKRPSI